MPTTNDYIAQEVQGQFFAVLVEPVLLETRDDAINIQFPRGIYYFQTSRARNTFTKACNEAKGRLVAYRMTRKQCDINATPKRRRKFFVDKARQT